MKNKTIVNTIKAVPYKWTQHEEIKSVEPLLAIKDTIPITNRQIASLY